MKLYHDSRNPEYRLPLGARKAGETVTLRLRVQDSTPDRVILRLWWANAEKRYEMTASSHGDGFFEYALTLPEEAGLLWYFFIVETNGCAFYYGNAYDQLGGVGAMYATQPPSYQLTVYAPDYKTPEWMRDGIMYQIMCDRFYGVNVKQPPQGWLHEDWHEPPSNRVLVATGDNTADDFFGGNLEGVEEKLPYLKELGVTVIYFNPIFRSPSNHKYNTGDYNQIDPSFGTDKDFVRLCRKAEKMGIRVILDGVFSHTGSDSKYFNKNGNYGNGGAYRSKRSPYFKWFSFEDWPIKYDSWWGFKTLPNVNEMEPSYIDYILTGDKAIVPKWLNKGASGWRLDVADELPMEFLRILRKSAKAEKEDSCVLGEVWEDASHKEAYGEVRSYCLGDTLDSVMNYPLREGVIEFLLGRISAPQLKRRLDSLFENYPEPFYLSLMNLLGSHDKARVINRLSGATPEERSREARVHTPLTPAQYALGRLRYIKAWQFVCSLPGMPCIYYGDEAGQQGEDDPFCRATYPWGREDTELVETIRHINHERLNSEVLRRGTLSLYVPDDDTIVVTRTLPGHPDYEFTLKRD